MAWWISHVRSARRDQAMTVVRGGVLISLAGHFPTARQDMRATVGAEAYDILTIDHGMAQANTRLSVEKVTA